jgi:hypothetical protein
MHASAGHIIDLRAARGFGREGSTFRQDERMLTRAGFKSVTFSSEQPLWRTVGIKSH